MRFILLFGFVFSFLKKKKRKRTATLRPSHRTMRGSGQTNQPLLLNDWMLTERRPGCEHSDMALPDERIRILRQRAHDQLCGKLCRASCGVYIYTPCIYKFFFPHSIGLVVLEYQNSYISLCLLKQVHTTIGCGKQGFPSAQPYLSHTPAG